MIKFLVTRPVSVIMIYLSLVLLGVIAVNRIPISPLPNIDIPEITIHISKKNTSAIELEKAIIRLVRQRLQQVADLDRINTETRNDYSIIRLLFNHGTDINHSFIDVNEKIDQSMANFPRDVDRPRVVKSNVGDIPVFYLNLRLKEALTSSSKTNRFLELSTFAVEVIKRRLEQLPEIAFVDITGTVETEIYIKPDIAATTALGINADDFQRIIENNNVVPGNLEVVDGASQYTVRFATKSLGSVDDLKKIVFRHGERIIRLGDISDIGLRRRQSKGSFVSNGEPSIHLAIIKQPSAKLDDLRLETKKLMAGFEGDYPEIIFEQVQDQTELLEYSIANLKKDLLYGSVLAFIMMFFFLKNFRAPILIGITIPVSLILTILVFDIINLTINIISLSGLVLGVGLMIDNSIIVIDNITQHNERGKSLLEACSKGASEIVRPLLSSALTTCSVFLPLIFLSGISGALFYDQAMAITIGLFISLAVSVTLLPVLFYIFHNRITHSFDSDFFDKYGITFFEKAYKSGLNWTFKNKSLAVVIILILIGSNVFLFLHLPKEKLPAIKQTEILAHINWNYNSSIEENTRRVGGLIAHLEKSVELSNALIGEQQFILSKDREMSPSEVTIYLKASSDVSVEDIKVQIKAYLEAHYPDATWVLNAPKSIFERVFGEVQAPLVVGLSTGTDKSLPEKVEVQALSAELKKRFTRTEIAVQAMQSSISLHLNSEKLLNYNLTSGEVFNQLATSINSKEITSHTENKHQLPVVITEDNTNLEEMIQKLFLRNRAGFAYPASELVTITKEESYKTVFGDENGIFIPLSIETKEPLKVINFLRTEYRKPAGIELSLSGGFFSNQKLVRDMTVVIVVAILLLYFILAAQFESLIQPIIILIELPISMSGALILLYIFNSSLNLISMIGLVVMCGIIINDSILKIDTINQLRRSGNYTLMDAIHIGGKRRLKSIIMTSLVTILSVLPFLFGNDVGSMLQRPLSLALIGGMIVGTPVSLYFIPLLYWFYYRNSQNGLIKDNI